MAFDDDVADLARIPILGALEPDARRLLAFSAETRILRAGDALFRRGDASDGGFVVLSGSIEMSGSPGEPTTLARPGVLIGEMALIDAVERRADAVAREASTVLKIPRALFLRLLQTHPQSALAVRAVLADRLRAFVAQLDEVRRRSFGA